ncbi:hypothetical protein ABPG77_004211 [Micractinium sp. CCAP 211/92]
MHLQALHSRDALPCLNSAQEIHFRCFPAAHVELAPSSVGRRPFFHSASCTSTFSDAHLVLDLMKPATDRAIPNLVYVLPPIPRTVVFSFGLCPRLLCHF